MAKIWKKTNNRIVDRERKLEIPFDHYVHAEPGFFAKYGSSFSRNYDHPPKGAINVVVIDWNPPPAKAPEVHASAQDTPEEPLAPGRTPGDTSPTEGAEVSLEAVGGALSDEPQRPTAEKKAKGKGKK